MFKKFAVRLRKRRKLWMFPRKLDVYGFTVPRQKHQKTIWVTGFQAVLKELGLLPRQVKGRVLGEVLRCCGQFRVPGMICDLTSVDLFFGLLPPAPQTLKVPMEVFSPALKPADVELAQC